MVALARALMAGTRHTAARRAVRRARPRGSARRLGEVLANLKSEGVSVLIAESNEVHVLDLLAARLFSSNEFHRGHCHYARLSLTLPVPMK